MGQWANNGSMGKIYGSMGKNKTMGLWAKIKLWAYGQNLQTTDYRLQTTDYRLQTTDYRLRNMGHSNNRITKDGGLCPKRDVSVVLGLPAPSGDWGYLCSNAHGRTNKWAKYKPVKFNSRDSVDGYWRATDGKCGLTIPTFTAIGTPTTSGLLYALFNKQGAWGYDPPTDGHPYRLGDFIGYRQTAENPITVSDHDISCKKNSKAHLEIEIGTNQEDDVVQLSDLTINGVKGEDCYLGIAFRMTSSTFFYGTGTTPIGDKGSLISVDGLGPYSHDTTIECYPFLSTIPIHINDSSHQEGGVFVPLDNTVIKVNIRVDGGFSFFLICERLNESGRVSLGAHFTNNSTWDTKSFRRIYISVHETTGASPDKADSSNMVFSKSTDGEWSVGPKSNLFVDLGTDTISFRNDRTYWVYGWVSTNGDNRGNYFSDYNLIDGDVGGDDDEDKNPYE